jgi:hypothetical protein
MNGKSAVARSFPPTAGFSVRLVDQGYFGMLPRFFDDAGRDLAGFAWGSWMDVAMRSWAERDIPVGVPGLPFSETEERWDLVIWQDGGQVFVEEADPDRHRETVRFTVPRDDYFAAWHEAIREASETCSTYFSLEEAERATGPVTRLVLGSHSEESSLNDLGRVLRFPDLVQLRLLGYGVDELPDGVGALSRLRFLDLARNGLTRLPDTVGELTGLELLDVMSNRLTDLPEPVFGLPRLRALNLIGNQFEVVPDGLRRLPALRSVRLDGNPLPESEFARLHAWFDDVEGFDTYFG